MIEIELPTKKLLSKFIRDKRKIYYMEMNGQDRNVLAQLYQQNTKKPYRTIHFTRRGAEITLQIKDVIIGRVPEACDKIKGDVCWHIILGDKK